MSDLISRSALLKAIEGVEVSFYLDDGVCGDNYDDTTIVDIINKQPTIEAAPILRGEWEVVNGVLTPGGDPLLRCPFCKSRESEHLGGIEFPVNWDYCPKCGADLRGKEHTWVTLKFTESTTR